MREIKFRAWDSESNIMLDSDACESILVGALNSGDYLMPMQYTGLNDRHGTEIYEGDVVDYFTDDRRRPIKRVVVSWRPERAGFNINAVTDKLVVGNIYQNPELAEGARL